MSQNVNKIIFNSKKLNSNTAETLVSDLSLKFKTTPQLNIPNTEKLNQSTKANSNTLNSLSYNNALGSYAPFVKTFVIRGIGYQSDIIEQPSSSEFPFNRYLSLRVGHSFLIYKPIPNYIGVKVTKKDRKLVIYGTNKEQVANFSKVIFKLRTPSVYTGRGIRIKKGQHRRKLGKKDIRKGKV